MKGCEEDRIVLESFILLVGLSVEVGRSTAYSLQPQDMETNDDVCFC